MKDKDSGMMKVPQHERTARWLQGEMVGGCFFFFFFSFCLSLSVGNDVGQVCESPIAHFVSFVQAMSGGFSAHYSARSRPAPDRSKLPPRDMASPRLRQLARRSVTT